MAFDGDFTKLKFNPNEFAGRNIQSLPDDPSMEGIGAQELKLMFDNVPQQMVALGKIAEILDALASPLAGAGIGVTVNGVNYTLSEILNLLFNQSTGSGSGDMNKIVYDKNLNGIVDNSELLMGYTPETLMTNLFVSGLFTESKNIVGAINEIRQSAAGLDLNGFNIINNTVSNSKLATMAPMTLKGNNTGNSATPRDLTISQLQKMLDIGSPFIRTTIEAGQNMRSGWDMFCGRHFYIGGVEQDGAILIAQNGSASSSNYRYRIQAMSSPDAHLRVSTHASAGNNATGVKSAIKISLSNGVVSLPENYNYSPASGLSAVGFTTSGTPLRMASSRRYKTNIEDAEYDKIRDALAKLKVRTFTSTSKFDDNNQVFVGGIAEEYYEAEPSLAIIQRDDDGKAILGEDGKEIPEGINERSLIHYLVKGWQEHEKQISALEQRVEKLESFIEKICDEGVSL